MGRGIFRGDLLTLLNPYGLLGGVYFVLLFCVHGAVWLTTKSTGGLQERAGRVVAKLWAVLLTVAVAFLITSWFRTPLWQNVLARPAWLVLPLLPSSLDPAFSRTAFNTASSPLTLSIMPGIALVTVPVVILYQARVYCRFSDSVSPESLLDDESYQPMSRFGLETARSASFLLKHPGPRYFLFHRNCVNLGLLTGQPPTDQGS